MLVARICLHAVLVDAVAGSHLLARTPCQDPAAGSRLGALADCARLNGEVGIRTHTEGAGALHAAAPQDAAYALISTPTFPPRIQQPSKTTLPSASGPSGTRMAISSRYTAALAVAGAVTDTFERRSRAKFQGEMSNVPLMCRADSSRDAPTTSGPTSTLKPSTVPPERLPMPTRVIAELITSVASDAADVPSQPDDAADTSPRGSATRDPAGTASKSS
eukprot:CAMPEP_0115840294 /NCGR_PEP_ID=MMETSP0287-20121206/6695_1 /TAXON_ID=412157 /ORGANISM="Chrysochromulina rotalis, Strain UIO044" /LENGTH=218 /DNA_ID=CAMNT_0003293897 /DNA_START=240 /DNA_END=897 /DNA_ORIENTATION=+